MNRRHGFTLIELLVVISIIALLVALLLPALARAKRLAVQIQGSSNLRQIGIALHEYANEYNGEYPLACTPNFCFEDSNLGAGSNEEYEPLAGLAALYYSSYGYVANQPIINPQPGFLPPTASGISLLFAPETGSGFSQSQSFPPSVYDTQGLCTQWGNSFLGLSYWVDLGNIKNSCSLWEHFELPTDRMGCGSAVSGGRET